MAWMSSVSAVPGRPCCSATISCARSSTGSTSRLCRWYANTLNCRSWCTTGRGAKALRLPSSNWQSTSVSRASTSARRHCCAWRWCALVRPDSTCSIPAITSSWMAGATPSCWAKCCTSTPCWATVSSRHCHRSPAVTAITSAGWAGRTPLPVKRSGKTACATCKGPPGWRRPLPTKPRPKPGRATPSMCR